MMKHLKIKNTSACLSIMFAAFLVLFHCGGKTNVITNTEKKSDAIILSVGVFQDERIEKMSESDVREILKESLAMLERKFGKISITFEIKKEGSLADFFNEAKEKYPAFRGWMSKTYLLMNSGEKGWRKALYKYKPHITLFLKENWKLKDLQNYYKTRSYDKFAEKLIETYIEKLKILKNYKMKNGKELISENHYYHSYRIWKKLMEYQNSYDIILTNTILVYDDILKLYPHVVFKHSKVSGSSFESPFRKGYLAGTSSFSSVFELYSNEPYFVGEKTSGLTDLNREFMNKAIGGYLMAHELGHQIYWIPDVYDHPAGCLMDTKFENLEIGDGYKQLIKEYPVCIECQKYIKARNEIFKGQKLLNMGDRENARKHILNGLKMLPGKLDRNRSDIESYFMMLLEKNKKNNLMK